MLGTFWSDLCSGFFGSPNPQFLVLAAAFQGTLLALAVPLSYQILQRISAVYKSDVIVTHIRRAFLVRYFPKHLAFAVIITVWLRFAVQDANHSVTWTLLAWVALAFFVLSAFLIIPFFTKLLAYAFQPERVFDLFWRKALHSSETHNGKSELEFAFEGIGDLAVSATHDRRQPLVLKVLDKVLSMRQGAIQQLALADEGQRDVLRQVLNLLYRVHEAASASANEEVGRKTAAVLVHYLRDATTAKDLKADVEDILLQVQRMAFDAISRNCLSKYIAAGEWYTYVVFGENFCIDYLSLANSYYFATLQRMVDNGDLALFKHCVGTIANSNYGNALPHEDVINFYYEFLEPHAAITCPHEAVALSELLKDLYSENAVGKWLEKLDALVKKCAVGTSEELKKREEEVIQNAITTYKYHRLLDLFFDVGAYCLFRNKPELIRILFEYNQPPDADGSWSATDLVPENVDGLLRLYFRENYHERGLWGWEDHHGSSLYYKKYFLLLLLRILTSSRGGALEEVRQAVSEKWPPYHLHSLSYTMEEFTGLAVHMKEHNADLLRDLNISTSDKDDLIDDVLIPALVKCKERADELLEHYERRQPMSQTKLKEFQENVLSAFVKCAEFRELLQIHGLYHEVPTKERTPDDLRWYASYLDDKAAFFDSWHVHYSNWGERRGAALAARENEQLFEKVIAASRKFSDVDALLVLAGTMSAPIFITNYPTPVKQLENCGKVIWHWQIPDNKPSQEVFKGYFERDTRIPIYTLRSIHGQGCILLVDAKCFGQLLQLEGVQVSVRAFSEDPSLIDEYLAENPQNRTPELEKELAKKVLIRVWEGIKLEFEPTFHAGYVT